jgi:2-polyprenyl-3-methyl-5-hydroxy-6-metoxy-1,4-benzoquinol methylase
VNQAAAPDRIELWGFGVDVRLIDSQAAAYLSGFAALAPPGVERIWQEMDRVWREMGLSNEGPLDRALIEAFYRHPVWTLNGIFTAIDPVSVSHRIAIAQVASKLNARRIADYGGGIGELGVRIAQACRGCLVDVIEPYPSRVAIARAANHIGIGFVPEMRADYDLVIAQDVLEHVEDPVGLAARLSAATRIGGYLIFANCFLPVIKCHLPGTFHLRHTFPWVMEKGGLEYLGRVPGAEHAQLFRKGGHIQIEALRHRETWSRALGPLLNKGRALASSVLGSFRLTRHHAKL